MPVYCLAEERMGDMINFEKELAAYQPSLEVDEAEDKILKDRKNQAAD